MITLIIWHCEGCFSDEEYRINFGAYEPGLHGREALPSDLLDYTYRCMTVGFSIYFPGDQDLFSATSNLLYTVQLILKATSLALLVSILLVQETYHLDA